MKFMKNMLLKNEHKDFILNSIIQEVNSESKGLKTIKLSVNGNLEPFEKKIEEEISFLFILRFCIITDLKTLEDEGRTRITISFLKIDDFQYHIAELNEKLRIRQTPKQYLSALNKAIMIAEHFNNLFGEGIHNKTAELNELDEILQKLKD